MGRAVTFWFPREPIRSVAARRHARDSVMAAELHSRMLVKEKSSLAWIP
jgi:hypothetical protein